MQVESLIFPCLVYARVFHGNHGYREFMITESGRDESRVKLVRDGHARPCTVLARHGSTRMTAPNLAVNRRQNRTFGLQNSLHPQTPFHVA
jgi:hypothetical protein